MLRVLDLAPVGSRESRTDFERMRDRMLAALYASPSRMVLIPIQDLFGWRERINLPGTVAPANWSWRLPLAIEEMTRDPEIGSRIAALRSLAKESGR